MPLTEPWDVARWLAAAQSRIAEIHARQRVAIIVGGTGLYIRALTRGLADLPPASAALREKLDALPLSELLRQLTELDPESASRIDSHNPRRVIRALEVCLLTGKPFSNFREQWNGEPSGWRGIVLTREREKLYARINRRTEAMFESGVVEEVRNVGDVGPTASQTLGLREIRAHIDSAMTKPECIAAIQQATRRYAKRQLTWFRRETDLRAVPMSSAEDEAALLESLSHEVRAQPHGSSRTSDQ